MCFIIDHSGRIAKRPTIKDVITNADASWCVGLCILFVLFTPVAKINWLRTFKGTVLTKNTKHTTIQVILATIKGSLNRVSNHAPQMSAYTLKRAILVFYAKHKLFPDGLCSELPAVSDWALKSGAILKKLVGG